MSDRLTDYDERELRIDQRQTQIELYEAQLRWDPCKALAAMVAAAAVFVGGDLAVSDRLRLRRTMCASTRRWWRRQRRPSDPAICRRHPVRASSISSFLKWQLNRWDGDGRKEQCT
jgi:hypothetical protein